KFYTDVALFSFGVRALLLRLVQCQNHERGCQSEENEKFYTDVALFSFGSMLYFLDCCSAKAMRGVARVKKTSSARPSSGHEGRRFKSDVRTIDCALRWGVEHRFPKVLEVMHACVRRGHGEAAVKVFDQMLEKGPVPGADLINKAVSGAFFQLVVGILSDESIRMDGLRLLELVRAHGIDPSPTIQNRLLAAWENQFPDSVLEYFLNIRREGVKLSTRVFRSIVVARERVDPEFVSMIYSGVGVGIELEF
ncbi:unnamed protein product, partial [Prorocentrum cordatum]